MHPGMTDALRDPDAIAPPWWACVETWPAPTIDLPNRAGRRAREAERRREARRNRKAAGSAS